MVKNRKQRLRRVIKKPKREKLAWPGLKAKDRLSRVVTQAVKEAREAREDEIWAQDQIARVLDYVSPHTAMNLVMEVTRHRRRPKTANAKRLPRGQ